MVVTTLVACGSGTLATQPGAHHNSHGSPSGTQASGGVDAELGNTIPETAAANPGADTADMREEAAQTGLPITTTTSQNPDATPDHTPDHTPANTPDGTADTSAATGTSPSTQPSGECGAGTEQLQQLVVALTNQARQQARQCGGQTLPATGTLLADATLASAARVHAEDMASNNFFNHTGSDGLGVAERVENLGFDWLNVGENIAAGQGSLELAHSGWLESPGHCRNIMEPDYTRIGVACAEYEQSDYQRYWAVVFARSSTD